MYAPPKYQPAQAGAVVVFKPGVTPQQAAAALAKIADVLESQPRIERFDPRFGGPVFYIP